VGAQILINRRDQTGPSNAAVTLFAKVLPHAKES